MILGGGGNLKLGGGGSTLSQGSVFHPILVCYCEKSLSLQFFKHSKDSQLQYSTYKQHNLIEFE